MALQLVHVRYQKLDLTFTPDAGATVRQLRVFLHEKTRVAPARQKLIGLPALTPDSAALSSVKLKARLMLIGTPDEVHDAAASEAAAGLAAASSIADDLDIEEPLSSPVHLLEGTAATHSMQHTLCWRGCRGPNLHPYPPVCCQRTSPRWRVAWRSTNPSAVTRRVRAPVFWS